MWRKVFFKTTAGKKREEVVGRGRKQHGGKLPCQRGRERRRKYPFMWRKCVYCYYALFFLPPFFFFPSVNFFSLCSFSLPSLHQSISGKKEKEELSKIDTFVLNLLSFLPFSFLSAAAIFLVMKGRLIQ